MGTSSSYQVSHMCQVFSFAGSNIRLMAFWECFRALWPRDSPRFKNVRGANTRCLDGAGFQPISLVGSQLLSHVGSHLGLFVLKSPKMAAFSSPPALGRSEQWYNACGTSGVDKIPRLSWWVARNNATMCLEQGVLTKIQNDMRHRVEGCRTVPK